MACTKCGMCGERPDCQYLIENIPKKKRPPVKTGGPLERFWPDMYEKWRERYGRM